MPPSWGDIGDVKAEDEWQRDQVEECIEVLHHHFKESETKNDWGWSLKKREIRFDAFAFLRSDLPEDLAKYYCPIDDLRGKINLLRLF